MISQKDVISELDIAALSTFKRSNVINLAKYTRDELFDIIQQRIILAFHQGTVLQESSELIADIASEWGDARFAIELLWKAGMYTDEQHEQLLIPEHVRAAKAETYSVVTETKLQNLTKHQLLTLLAIAKRLQKLQTAYITTGEIENTYAITCEEYGEKPTCTYHVLELFKRNRTRWIYTNQTIGKRTSWNHPVSFPYLTYLLRYLLKKYYHFYKQGYSQTIGKGQVEHKGFGRTKLFCTLNY